MAIEKYTYLIIGGGIAGTTAAETLRKKDILSSIAIVSDEPYTFYSRVLLSKPSLVRGDQPLDSVWLKKQEWYDTNHIILISGISATTLDPLTKKVLLSNGDEIGYDKLLLATGAHSRKWSIPGADKKGIFYLRGLDDAKAIMEAVKTKKQAILVGSGCVSFEIAEILRSLNIKTTLVMREKYFSEPILSEPEGKIIEKILEEHGAVIKRSSEVAEVLGKKEVVGVTLKNGVELPCDMIMCMIGIVYPTEWLKSSGIQLNRGIVANEFLETSLPDVWTAGDITEYNDQIIKETLLCGNWMNARGQGETAAFGMLGQRKGYGAVTSQTSRGFKNTIGFTGDTRILPERKFIFRGSPEKNAFCRIILRDKNIVGATFINRTQEMGTVTKIIREAIDVSKKETELTDENFDLKTLLSAPTSGH